MTENAKLIDVEIEIPPSLNNLYFSMSYKAKDGKYRCRRVLSGEGKAYKHGVGFIIKSAAQRAGWFYSGERLSMRLRLIFRDRRRRDITNCIKIVEDAASEALNFDDTVVDIFSVFRSGVDKERPRAYLTIAVIE